ncbi:AfsA-related hotdog domain-containing protein [Paraburkholderia sp.]|uniref:AfsA-related hotdog domain-containing protein n=1 Tax=Paraburkholderia sp. TaxID=1926495 RepID=UPI0025DAA74F|nr:AfsA-related hotdog domain-containing protein [Paraburkholderia sp.]
MNNEVIVLVGDKFANFASLQQGVKTYSMLQLVVQSDQFPEHGIVVGQGVDLHRLSETIRLSGQEGVRVEPAEVVDCHHDESHRRLVHKQYGHNVLVTPPERIDETRFGAKLQLHDDCAELADHVTGQHIQGMVFVEAARQLMLCVTEKYVLDEHARLSSYFVLNEMRTTFLAFAFPIETDCIFTLTDYKRKTNGPIKASCVSEFSQAGQVVARVEIDFAAYPKSQLSRKEHELATAALTRYRNMQEVERSAAEAA